MIIVDGKALAQKILSRISTGLNGRSVSIAAVWAEDNLAIGRFVEMKKKYAEAVGINMDIFRLGSEDALMQKIKELAEDKNITGIIVELPLPPGYDRDKILELIPQEKDIDVLSSSAQESFYNNRSGIDPPSVGALKILFEEYKVSPQKKTAAVFGQSILIGKPISHWLEQNDAKVFRIDENTENPQELCLQADIVVSGVGKPDLITGDMIKPAPTGASGDGAVVVDFGFEKLGDKISGDMDFDSVAPKASLITPVPGGMGPLVIASFLENVLKLYLSSER